MRHWKGIVVVGVLAVVVGAVLVIRSGYVTEMPTASEYSSPWDLARDLNDHGLGCSDPTRRPSTVPRLTGVPEPVLCSVEGRSVVLDVIPQEFLKVWVRYVYPGVHYTDVQDLAEMYADRGADGLRRLGIEAILVGPNWAVETTDDRDSLSVLSAIRAEIGGTLLVASSTTTPSPSTSDSPLA